MMTGSMNSTTDSRRRRPGRSAVVPLLLLAIALAGIASQSPAVALAAKASPASLNKILTRAEKDLQKAYDAARGKDPGRVSNILRRADENLARFESGSGLAELKERLEQSVAAAERGDLAAAEQSIAGARALLPALTDYAIPRNAEAESRKARRAAASGDAESCIEALEQFEAAMKHDILIKRLREAREATARARTAMVRNDMPGGREEIEAALTAVNGLRFAGTLSRALFAMQLGIEFVEGGVAGAAKGQVQKALQEMRLGVERAPETQRDEFAATRETLLVVWKRMSRPEEGDLDTLKSVTQNLEEMRDGQE